MKAMLAAQQFKVPLPAHMAEGGLIDVDAEMMSPTEYETAQGTETRRRSVGAFTRGIVSPTKVHQHMLKDKTGSTREKKKEQEKERSKDDKEEGLRTPLRKEGFWRVNGCGTDHWLLARQ